MNTLLDIPQYSRVDHIWDLKISNINPKEQITISASMIDLFGHHWTSHAVFLSDTNTINLAKQAPILGSYSNIDPMGLIWSMQCEDVHGLLSRRFDLSPAKIEFQIKNSKEEVLTTKIITRYLIEPDIVITSVRDNGLVGTLYQPKNTHQYKYPAVIVLSGSEGGFRHEQAALLASEGYTAFALAYFIHGQREYTDLPHAFPSKIHNIPLEYFKKAIDYLQQQPNVDPNKIGIVGTSRGAELALLLGSVFLELRCVVAYVPNHAVQAAFGPSDHLQDETEPSWTYRGKSLACSPLKVKNVDWFGHKPVILKQGFVITPESINHSIAVENINGPVLLISGGDDNMWPSQIMSELIMERLERKKHRYLADSRHIHYESAGHLIMTPWWPTTGLHAIHPVDQVDYDFGGNPQADAHAGYHSWAAIKAFLSQQFEPV